MSLSGGGPEGFGLLSLAFPSNIMTLQNTTDIDNFLKSKHIFIHHWGWHSLLKKSIWLSYKEHSIINKAGKANRGQCCQAGFSSSYQEWIPKVSASFPLRAQRISAFYLDSHFRNPLGTHCMPSVPDA